MSENSQHSQPANAGISIVERIKAIWNNQYDIEEMPIHQNRVRMELSELKRFCRYGVLFGRPLFCLEVGENVYDGVAFPVKTPYRKWFTFYEGICYYAVEVLPKQDALAVQKGVN